MGRAASHHFFDRVLKAGSGAALGALGGLFLVSAVDAKYASGAGHFGQCWLADAGLLAPLSLLMVGLVAALRLFFHDGRAPQPWTHLSALADSEASDRARFVPLALFAPLGVVLWLVVVANVATRLLASDVTPSAAGGALALSAVASAWVAAQLLTGLSVAVASAPWVRKLDPRTALFAGLCSASLLLGYAVWSGVPSGAGGALAVFGVFKRPELDLRGTTLLLVLALASYFGPAPKVRGAAFVALGVCCLPLLLTLRAARHGLNARAVSLGIERQAPLGKLALATLRKRFDADHDGYSRLFGGGDCDDHDAARNPAAFDVPGNGRDEDCSGADEPLTAPAAVPEKAPESPEAARKALPEHFNVVLISIDTLRHDLGEAPRPVTPNLDKLAEDSVVYDRAYSLASYTAKSVGPFLMGKYSSETHRDWSHFNRFGSKDVFVAQRLQREGVHTVSVQGFWYFFMNTGLERGFDVINKSAAPAAISVDGDSNTNGDKVSDAALQELGKPELLQQPFFMWIHYVDPHAEYVPHAGFDFGSSSRQLYDGEVAFVDHHVGRVLDALEHSLFYDHTVVIVTSDHGEAFAEHGMIRHGFELWEELVRVPLIVRVPGVSARHLQVRRSAIDLAPTILDLCGVNPGAPEDLSGTSLVPDFVLPAGAEPAPRPIFVDMAAGPNNAEREALIDGDLKLVESGGRPLSLFDLATDPGEKQDLLDDASRAEPMLAKFKAFRHSLHEVIVRAPE